MDYIIAGKESSRGEISVVSNSSAQSWSSLPLASSPVTSGLVLVRDISSISGERTIGSAGIGTGRIGQFRAVLSVMVLRNETFSSKVESGQICPRLWHSRR